MSMRASLPAKLILFHMPPLAPPVEFPLTEWHKIRNNRIYQFLITRKEFEKIGLINYVYRERYLLSDVKGFWHTRHKLPSAFILNFTEYLIQELKENGIIIERKLERKMTYKIIRKPTKQLIDEICQYTWTKDP